MTADPSITVWQRIEPRARDLQLQESLTARIHDPLWLLARQWATGEFAGQDAGSPAQARLRATISPLSRYRARSGPVVPYDPSVSPLEGMVEAEARFSPANDAICASPPKPECTCCGSWKVRSSAATATAT
jgi:hypothetical protein